MYEIVSLELTNQTVTKAFEAIANGRTKVIPDPGQRFVLITDNSDGQSGDGNPGARTIVIVGHGSPNGVSGQATWALYSSHLHTPPQTNPDTVYVVACSTSGEGRIFLDGNFANSVKRAFPQSNVWATSTAVSPPGLLGDWQKL